MCCAPVQPAVARTPGKKYNARGADVNADPPPPFFLKCFSVIKKKIHRAPPPPSKDNLAFVLFIGLNIEKKIMNMNSRLLGENRKGKEHLEVLLCTAGCALATSGASHRLGHVNTNTTQVLGGRFS